VRSVILPLSNDSPLLFPGAWLLTNSERLGLLDLVVSIVDQEDRAA